MHARRALVPVLLLAGYALTQCGSRVPVALPSADEDMPEAPGVLEVAEAPRTLDELKARIAQIMAHDRIPGAAIALVDRNGPIWVGGIGVRDRDTKIPMDADTAFRVGSLSKSIVALGVMRLADQGKLDIDRPLREILPDVGIDNPWESVAPVTLAQCLEHTAGLDDVRFNEVFSDDEALPVRDALAINPRSKKIRWRPGTRHAYSNVGYTLAARAIEVASGEPFDQYIRREILQPLGIVDADFRRTSLLASRLATGYMEQDTPATFHPFAHRPAGALLASASDLAKLVHFWTVRGEGYPPIVSPEGLARIESSGTLPYPHTDNDYGFANYGDVSHPVLSRGHDGGMPGFHASVRYFPKLGVGYAMLVNANYSFRGYFSIRALLFSYLTQGKSFPPPNRVERGDRPGAGYFALANPRNEFFGFMDTVRMGWRVRETDDGLRIDELVGWSYSLVPTADGGYRHVQEYGSSVRFTTSIEGRPIMVMSFLYAEAAPLWFALVRYAAMSFAMLLLEFAPVWAAAILAYSALRRRRILPMSLVVWPAVASLACGAMPKLLEASFHAGVIGVVHPLTVATCAATILFAVASIATFATSIRWAMRPDRPPVWHRVFPFVCGVAFVAMTVWWGVNGWIGFRTWAW